MTISIGQRVPTTTVRVLKDDGVDEVSTDVLLQGKVVVFGVPGAFTPTCSAKHLPGYIEQSAAIRAKGADEIVCMAVNDAFVMGAWGKDRNVGDKVLMLGDGSAAFSKALGLELDLTKMGLGVRSKRYSMLVVDGVVKQLNIEDAPAGAVKSGADTMLSQL